MKQMLQFQQRNLLSLLLILVFLWSLTGIDWGSALIHTGGMATLTELITSLFHPDLSGEILSIAIQSTWITLSYAVVGMVLALIIAFVFGILASGILLTNHTVFERLCSRFFRSLLGFLRAIHELIWAWLFVSAFGLTPYAAILAIGLPYGGILGRIFADMLKDVNPAPLNALRAAGASRLQLLFYGYFPSVKANMISYTMYRFECAIRSSAVMSFIGLGGLGYQIQLSLDDLHYQEVWTFVLFLIGIVVLIDVWSSQWRGKLQQNNSKFSIFSIVLAVCLYITSFISIAASTEVSFYQLFTGENGLYAKNFFLNLLGVREEIPAFLSLVAWKEAGTLTYDTLLMSVLAIGISTILMIITVLPAARNIASGRLTSLKSRWNWPLYFVIRLAYILSRAVPELIWAMMIIFIFKPGILPGAIALALHNFGILGKLCAEVVEEIDEKPLKNLASSGASVGQLLVYGVVPMVFPSFLSFILYRFEVIMRTTIVVGFVGAGGLGQQFKLSMSFFHYSNITLLLICYLLLVWFADWLSEWSRNKVR